MYTLVAAKNTITMKFLGILYCSFITVFILMSLPVYLFRLVVILLSKIFCPDFGEILGEKSAFLVGDYLAETTPRSNVVLTIIFEGQLALEKVQALVVKNWISNKEFKKLQQYPVKWMGFTFWRNIAKPFVVNDYVHEYSGKHGQMKEQELDEFTEALLNRKPLKNQSPWELHLIQNYRHTINENESTEKAKPHSVLILKWHHCLMDGMGAGDLLERLFEGRWNRKLEMQLPEIPTMQKLMRYLTFPVKAFLELSSFSSHAFVDNPFKIPDSKKEWHQVYARSGLIPIRLVKDIKNKFGVSYTSVLISAISAAVRKTQMQKSESLHFLTVLPAIGNRNRKAMTNLMTGTTFDIPTTSYTNPVERLTTIHKSFEESRRSVKPIIMQHITSFCGCHLTSINELLTKNRMIPIGLTNFAGSQSDYQLNKNTKWIHTRTVAGCLSGVAGIGLTALSHGQNTEIHMAAERALMSRKEAQQFMHNVVLELEALGALISTKM